MQDKERVFGLDLMRAMAILFVLLSHTVFLLPFSKETQNLVFQYCGFFGVELFFVLSGYLVGKILIKLFNERSAEFDTVRYFWIRRWFRTLPAYYLALFLSAIVYYFSHKQVVFTEPYNFLYLVFLQNFVSPHPVFFSLAWSLSVEEWFYFLLPLWFIFFHWIFSSNKKYQFCVIISFLLLIIILRIIVVYVSNPEWDSSIRRLTPLRLDALITGVLSGFIHLYFKDHWIRYTKLCLVTGIVLFIAASVYFCFKQMNVGLPGDFFWKTFYFNVVSFAIAFILPYLTKIRKGSDRFFVKAITHISLVSYSLYLTHVIVMFVIITLMNKISVDGLNGLKFISCWFFCILGATVLYRVFELPMTNLREKFGERKQ